LNGIIKMKSNKIIEWTKTKTAIPATKKFDSNEMYNDSLEQEVLRVWDPFENTLSAAIMSGLEIIPINSTTNILYIGKIGKESQLNLLDLVENKQKNFILNDDSNSENYKFNNFEKINNIENIRGTLFSIIYIDDDKIPINNIIKILNDFLNKFGYIVIVLSRSIKSKFTDLFKKLSQQYHILQEVNIENYFPEKSLIIFSTKENISKFS